MRRRYGRSGGGTCYVQFRRPGPGEPWITLGRWGLRTRPGDAPRALSRIEAEEMTARLRANHPNISVRVHS